MRTEETMIQRKQPKLNNSLASSHSCFVRLHLHLNAPFSRVFSAAKRSALKKVPLLKTWNQLFNWHFCILYFPFAYLVLLIVKSVNGHKAKELSTSFLHSEWSFFLFNLFWMILWLNIFQKLMNCAYNVIWCVYFLGWVWF